MTSNTQCIYRDFFPIQKKPNRILRAIRKLCVPRGIRKRNDFEENLLVKSQVYEKWTLFLKGYFDGELEKFEILPKKKLNNEKIIWQYWGQGVDQNLPEIVKICFSSIDLYKGEYTVIRLDDHNLHEYIELPDFIREKRKNSEFKHAFFADLLRLALLNAYGGIWMDATILLTSEINHELLEQDFFMFHRSDSAVSKQSWEHFNSNYFGWSDRHKVNVLNSFIISKKNNDIVNICLDIMLNYWKTQSSIPHYFFFQIMFDVLKNEFLEMNDFLIVDDTLPHLLQLKLNEKFNSNEYKEIINLVNIHKMTYISNYDYETYYGYLKKTFMGNELE